MPDKSKALLVKTGTDGFLTLTLNRPDRLNALNPELLYALRETLEQASTARELKGIILRGAGGNFCAGGDIYIMKEAVDRHNIDTLSPFLSILEETAHAFYTCPLPTLSLVEGIVAGAGIGLALAADIHIAADTARCHFAFPALGAIPDAGASYLIPQVIGYSRAMEFYISNEPLDALTARKWGFFHEVVPGDGVEECLRIWKEKIERLSPEGFKLSKDLFQKALTQPMQEQVRAEYFAQLSAMKAEHFSKKVAALTAKKDKNTR